MSWATIQAFDTDDDTIYVLCQEDEQPISAYWPQPLEELRPDAVRLPAYTNSYSAGLVANGGNHPRWVTL